VIYRFRVPSDFIYPFFFPFRCRYYSAPGNESDYPFALLSPAAGAGAPADQWQAVTMPRDDLIQPTIGLQPHVCYLFLTSIIFCSFLLLFLFFSFSSCSAPAAGGHQLDILACVASRRRPGFSMAF
jgi:hypothetical protein